MSVPYNFLKHPLIGDYCVTTSDLVIRRRNANGVRVRTMRVAKPGCIVMLKPDPEANPGGEDAWLAILTWIQPEKEVQPGKVRLCEVWWIYTRQHLLDIVKSGKTSDKRKLLEDTCCIPKKRAWVSNHFSDEPLDSIITVPNYDEIGERIKLYKTRYVQVDVANGVYEFVDMKP